MRYYEIIKEGRDALLYHGYNEMQHALEAIESGRMAATTTQRFWADGRRRTREDDPDYEDSYWMKGVSFTRDMRFALNWGIVVIAVNQAKLTQKTKVIPFNWGFSNAPGATHKREFEEFAIVKATKDTYKFPADDEDNPGGFDINRFMSKTGIEGWLPLNPILEGIWLDTYAVKVYRKKIGPIINHPKFKGYYFIEGKINNDRKKFKLFPADYPIDDLPQMP